MNATIITDNGLIIECVGVSILLEPVRATISGDNAEVLRNVTLTAMSSEIKDCVKADKALDIILKTSVPRSLNLDGIMSENTYSVYRNMYKSGNMSETQAVKILNKFKCKQVRPAMYELPNNLFRIDE